jgi:hypothetical protein
MKQLATRPTTLLRIKTITRQTIKSFLLIPKALTNRRKQMVIRQQKGLRVHFGCGSDHLKDFLNIDSQLSHAVDMTMDLNDPSFSPSSIAFAFSNAFFEHLYRDSRLPHLRAMHESLQDNGICCYIGIPYFRNIAKFYVERGPGTVGSVFDLYNVYRYTHGDPEQGGIPWLEQLHKSLFDEEELTKLLRDAGFGAFVLFCYAYPGDANKVPVNIGFYATKQFSPLLKLREDCRTFLSRFADIRICMDTLTWIN